MTKTRPATVLATALGAVLLLLLALALGYRAFRPAAGAGPSHSADPPSSATSSAPGAATPVPPGALFGRVTTVGGEVYEGRLRWGGDEEAFWGDQFNGVKAANPWVAHVPADQRPTERHRVELLGLRILDRERPADLSRPFLARFGDVARIEAHGEGVGEAIRGGTRFDPRVRVTLKSGSAFDLDRLASSDFDDGLRVWDATRGTVDLEPRQVRSVEFLPAAGPHPGAPSQLHGTVTTDQGRFTGFVQWNREEGAGSDELEGRTAEGQVALRFDAIRTVERRSGDGVRVTLRDGGEVVLSGTPEAGEGNRGVYVDDLRYGRVLVSWEAFWRLDLDPVAAGPAYADFPQGRPLSGRVTTRDGRRLAGRLVFDLDESETTETLDAPSGGVDYTLPFGLVASIQLGGAQGADPEVTLHNGEVLRLERSGDLGDGNAGLLIFGEGGGRPDYLPWKDVEAIDLERPLAMYPPLDTEARSNNRP